MHPDQLRSRRRVGMMEIGEDSYGRTWRVKKDGVCVLMSNENAPVSETYDVRVIVLEQIGDAPNHWALYVGPENGQGWIIQVIGDPYPGMHRTDSAGCVNIFASGSFRRSELLGQISPQKLRLIRNWANCIPPPTAQGHHPDNHNCQHWTWFVVRLLEREKLVQPGATDFLRTGIGLHWQEW